MESCSREARGETLSELQAARLDRLAKRIRELPEDREVLLMEEVNGATGKVPEAYTLEEAAGLLACHKETVRRAIKAGSLQAAKIGKNYRISKADLEKYYRSRGGGSLFADCRNDPG